MGLFQSYKTVLVITTLVALACFWGDNPSANAAASSAQEVVDVWDENCAIWNFDECPSYVLDGAACTVTMGDVYNGSNFTIDCEGLMVAIQIELDSGYTIDPGDGDELNSVILDDSWFE